jgi:predicted RNase H-like nuclease (RuvC/YqgF family)
MNKWIAVLVIAVLVIGITVMAVIMTQQIGKLNDELDSAEVQIAALSSEVSSLENNISTLQTKLADSENEASALQANLDAANTHSAALEDTIRSLQSTISAQVDELKKIKYPRHFASLAELTNWLQKDDTNVKYPGVSVLERAYILQVKALQDGYLLPVRIPLAAIGLSELDSNFAVIGDIIYTVRASDDSVQRWSSTSALPSYPIPPE